jgi:hypothetical protein
MPEQVQAISFSKSVCQLTINFNNRYLAPEPPQPTATSLDSCTDACIASRLLSPKTSPEFLHLLQQLRLLSPPRDFGVGRRNRWVGRRPGTEYRRDVRALQHALVE